MIGCCAVVAGVAAAMTLLMWADASINKIQLKTKKKEKMKNKINKKTKVQLSEKVAIAIRKAIIEDVKVIKSDDDFSLALNAAIIGCAAFVASAYSAVGVEDPDKDVARLYRHAADQLERKGGEA